MKNTYWQHEGICRKHLKRRVYIKSYDNIFSLLTIFLSFTIYHVHNAVHSFRFFFFSRNVDVLVYILPIKKKKKKSTSNEKSRYITIDHIYIIHFTNLYNSEPVVPLREFTWNENVDRRSSILSNTFDYVVVDIPSIDSIDLERRCVGWIGSFHSLALNKRTIYGATSWPSLVLGCSSLGSSHLVVMPHLVGWGPPPSPGARIGACVQFGMVGPGVVGCCAATGWRTSCGNRAIACLQFRKVIECKKKKREISKRMKQPMYRDVLD